MKGSWWSDASSSCCDWVIKKDITSISSQLFSVNQLAAESVVKQTVEYECWDDFQRLYSHQTNFNCMTCWNNGQNLREIVFLHQQEVVISLTNWQIQLIPPEMIIHSRKTNLKCLQQQNPPIGYHLYTVSVHFGQITSKYTASACCHIWFHILFLHVPKTSFLLKAHMWSHWAWDSNVCSLHKIYKRLMGNVSL